MTWPWETPHLSRETPHLSRETPHLSREIPDIYAHPSRNMNCGWLIYLLLMIIMITIINGQCCGYRVKSPLLLMNCCVIRCTWGGGGDLGYDKYLCTPRVGLGLQHLLNLTKLSFKRESHF